MILFFFVGHPGHPGPHKRKLKLQEVESLPLIFYDRGSSDWTLTNGLFRRAGLLPNVVLEVEGIETCKRMVLRRLGLAFLPQLAVTPRVEVRETSHHANHGCGAAAPESGRDSLAARKPLEKTAQRFLDLLRSATVAR